MNNGRLEIEILRLTNLSSASDFDPLFKNRGISARFAAGPQEIGTPDILIIPGTRNAIGDYRRIKDAGFTQKIKRILRNGSVVLGIAGGFEMMGQKIIDIKQSESGLSQSEGLSIFNCVTRIMPSVACGKVDFQWAEGASGDTFRGFESHKGRTKYLDGCTPLFRIVRKDGREVEIYDGAVSEERNAFGTYIHGVFDNNAFCEAFFDMVIKRRRN